MGRLTLASVTDSPGMPIVRCNDLLIAEESAPVLKESGLDSLDALFAAPGAELLDKPGLSPWRQRLRVTLGGQGTGHTFYLKRFIRPPASTRGTLTHPWGRAKTLAGAEWTWMQHLRREGIACPSPVALGEEVNGSREIRSAILTAAAPGRSLEAWVRRRGETADPSLRPLIAPLAVLIRRLHRLGYVHRDLYLSHVFWDPGSPAESSLCLIDLQRVMRPRWRLGRWIVKDLAALNFSTPPHAASAADRIRWLKRYLGVTRLDLQAKGLAYRILGKTLQIARHERRRQARLSLRSHSR